MKFSALALMGAITSLAASVSGCAGVGADIQALSQDKATACIHESVTGMWGSQNITVIRSNSDQGSTVSETQTGGCSVTHNNVKF